jgi:hypothetical protein
MKLLLFGETTYLPPRSDLSNGSALIAEMFPTRWYGAVEKPRDSFLGLPLSPQFPAFIRLEDLQVVGRLGTPRSRTDHLGNGSANCACHILSFRGGI